MRLVAEAPDAGAGSEAEGDGLEGGAGEAGEDERSFGSGSTEAVFIRPTTPKSGLHEWALAREKPTCHPAPLPKEEDVAHVLATGPRPRGAAARPHPPFAEMREITFPQVNGFKQTAESPLATPLPSFLPFTTVASLDCPLAMCCTLSPILERSPWRSVSERAELCSLSL